MYIDMPRSAIVMLVVGYGMGFLIGWLVPFPFNAAAGVVWFLLWSKIFGDSWVIM